jgi:hypothetical protein
LTTLLMLAFVVSGCGGLSLNSTTQDLSSTLQSAGYQTLAVGNDVSSDAPPGGLVTIAYTRGPTGNVGQDARHAEKVVWDSYPYRFGGISIVQYSAACAPACPSHSFSVTYSQLAARFGPRPHGLGTASLVTANVVYGVLTVVGIAAAVTFVILWLRRSLSSRAKSPPRKPPWLPRLARPPWLP